MYVSVADWSANRYPDLELIQLTDTQGIGLADDSVFVEAEAQASGIIDSYLATNYAVPLTSIPPEIKLIALDLTRWVLHKQGAPEDVIIKKDEALSRLRDLARGVSVLTGNIPPKSGQASGMAYTIVAPIFSVDPGP